MEHNDDPYDSETEKRSREYSAWAFRRLALLTLILIGAYCLSLCIKGQ